MQILVLLSLCSFAVAEIAAQIELEQVLKRDYPFERVEDVVYCKGEDWSQKLDIYTPNNDVAKNDVAKKTDAKRPALLLIHGGGWAGRDKQSPYFLKLSSEYAKRGFVVFSINYRLSSEAPAPAAVQDVHCAARFVHAHAKKYGIDTDRIVVSGNSAGCHLGLMLAMCQSDLCRGNGDWLESSNKVRVVVNRFGITDAVERTFGAKPIRSSITWFTGVKGDPKVLAKKMSPLSYVSSSSLPPIFTIHGDADTNTPVSQGQRLHQGLLDNGHESEIMIVKGGNHGFRNVKKDVMKEIERRTFAFLLQQGLF